MSPKCFGCGTELIWGGDHDVEDDEEYYIVSNLSCPECRAFYLMYHPTNACDSPDETPD
jgi:DNA-directed RNA polymerase subunit RPC12/RpoP